eukprot:gene10052-10926_t
MSSFLILLLIGLLRHGHAEPRYSHLPLHELMQQSIYLKTTVHEEVVIATADKGSDLRPDDFVTHADGIRILNGGLDHFLKSGEKEAIVPVVDETDVKHGGNKLLGFVLIQSVTPRKLSTRRGEIVVDLEEGGPPPTMKLGNIVIGQDGAKTTNDPSYQPPPHGSGPCITGRDCYNYNGTCIEGQCKCIGAYTGTYCQLNRPDFVAMALTAKRMQDKKQQKPSVTHVVGGAEKATGDSGRRLERKIPAASEPEPKIETREADNKARESAQTSLPKSEEDSSSNTKKPGKKKKKAKAAQESPSEGAKTAQTQQPARELTVEDLYGEGRPYPEPLVAGRVPHLVARERQLKRSKRENFLYTVRFRTGPLGIVFDNKLSNATIVEKIVRGQQAEISDIREGDQLIAIETFNLTISPAKVSQRILNDLPWPKTLVFETRSLGEDPTLQEGKLRSRTYNMSIVYPPTLIGEYTFRLTEWTPFLTLQEDGTCPIFRFKSLEDPFGCTVVEDSYRFPSVYNDVIEKNGFVDEEIERESSFLSLLLQQSFIKRVKVEPRTAAIMKRGICTFIEKAKTLTRGGADLGLVVNTEDVIVDLPAGKERTDECVTPFGVMKSSEGNYLHLAAKTNEVWAVLTENGEGEKVAGACEQLLTVLEDLIDRWPHSVPHLPVPTILKNKPPDQSKVRGLTEEGGRVALSGENGWAFFDYHLAMFGPQEVPLGPIRLVMAIPPFGCDPNAYSVRISDAVVAILRGGGCSFGIKVINAQKLGAKAVMIVNTDDMKTMRLMALPDEVPLINIPTIMVSRRIQFYLEEQIRPYAPLNQHLISIQPTGVFGDYELKNTLTLPQRLQI